MGFFTQNEYNLISNDYFCGRHLFKKSFIIITKTLFSIASYFDRVRMNFIIRMFRICFFVFLFCTAFSTYSYSKSRDKDVFADSVMNEVFKRSELYGKYIVEYEAQAYIKGTTQVLNKNLLFKFAPDFFFLDKKNDNTILESILDIHFHAPNTFTQKIVAINGTSLKTAKVYEKVTQFLNVNVYNPTSFNNEVFMPTAKTGFRYYHFFYESAIDTLGYKFLKIRVEPKIKSQKLISGYIFVTDKLWTIARIEVKGKIDFLNFSVQTNFGLPESDFLVPKSTEIELQMKIFGNEVVDHYTSFYDYSLIKKYENEEERKLLLNNFDLSNHFNVKLDSIPVIKDSLFWEQNRKLALSDEEKKIYEEHDGIKNSFDSSLVKKSSTRDFTKGIFAPKKFEYNSTQFKYSGLLNPLKLAFWGKDGVTYWQKLHLSRESESGQVLSFSPDFGFVFKRNEAFFNTPVSFLFNPGKMGQIKFSLGNKNQAYNSKITDEIKETMPDSINFDDLNLKYYRHYYTALTGQYELINGLLAEVGVDYHLYNPLKPNVSENVGTEPEGETRDLIDEKYKSFTPTIGFQWTPKQYYRHNGKRKEYVWSAFPTFSFEYARGIPGIIDSNSDYERLEVDIQQRISLGLLRSVQYYAGVGFFSNAKSIYFADFKNFRRHNFPESWSDRIGGVFHLLDPYWYNASNSYVQLHAMYEAPFVFLQLFRNVTKDIFKERFYFSQLYTPALPSYTELGYGVGNYIFNVGVFVNFNKSECKSAGFKFAFELGR